MYSFSQTSSSRDCSCDAVPADLNETLYRETRRAENRLNDATSAVFRASDQAQRTLFDWGFRAASLQVLDIAWLRGMWQRISWQSAAFGELLGNSPLAGLELEQARNTLQVFGLVKNGRRILNVSARGEIALRQLLQTAYAMGHYPALWAVEGLGHDFAASRWQEDGEVQGILSDLPVSELPIESRTMMHAGIGLFFAERLLPEVTPFSPRRCLRQVLDRFLRLCRTNSCSGYTGCAIESLGLVTRTWHPQLVLLVDRELSDLAPGVVSYFWHGVGRALYFFPLYILPTALSAWPAADIEAPHPKARRNARAGLAWATTLVNMRHPQILERLLRRIGGGFAHDGAFSNGVASAIVMAHDTVPDNTYLLDLIRHDPPHPATQSLWHRLVRLPAQEALKRLYPVLRRTGRMEEVFSCQNLLELSCELEARERNQNTDVQTRVA